MTDSKGFSFGCFGWAYIGAYTVPAAGPLMIDTLATLAPLLNGSESEGLQTRLHDYQMEFQQPRLAGVAAAPWCERDFYMSVIHG